MGSPRLGPASPVLMLKEMRSICRCYTSAWDDISVVVQAKIDCVICIFLTHPARSVAAIPPQWEQFLLRFLHLQASAGLRAKVYFCPISRFLFPFLSLQIIFLM